MPWKFDSLSIPIDPTSIERKVLRKQEATSILQQFPLPFDLGPDAFELTIKGFVWPSLLADQLWELTKQAEAPSIQIEVTDDEEHEVYSGLYAVNKASVKRKDPEFITVDGKQKAVHRFQFTFVQFGEGGIVSDGDSGDIDLDEDGVGFDIEDIFGVFDFDNFLNVIDDFFTV